MTFRYKFLTQSQLGLLFGVSSHKIGEWLVNVNLRTADKRPTREAHEDKYCDQAPSGQCGYNWVWNSEKTVERLIVAGHPLVLELPEEIVEPPALNGPFQLSSKNTKCVLSADGTLAAMGTCEQNAKVLLKLLNHGYQFGLERLTTPKSVAC